MNKIRDGVAIKEDITIRGEGEGQDIPTMMMGEEKAEAEAAGGEEGIPTKGVWHPEEGSTTEDVGGQAGGATVRETGVVDGAATPGKEEKERMITAGDDRLERRLRLWLLMSWMPSKSPHTPRNYPPLSWTQQRVWFTRVRMTGQSNAGAVKMAS